MCTLTTSRFKAVISNDINSDIFLGSCMGSFYDDPLRREDENEGRRSRQMLCVPVLRSQAGPPLGVIQVCKDHT